MTQIAFSFDKETLLKIGKGALIALTGSAAIGLLGFFGAIELGDPNLTMIVAWLIPTLTNIIREWMKGA